MLNLTRRCLSPAEKALVIHSSDVRLGALLGDFVGLRSASAVLGSPIVSYVEQLDDQLASDLAVSVVRLARHLRGRRQGAPVSLTQLSAMAILKAEGPMSPGQMATLERVQPPSMTRVIASLVELGYISRDPHPTDGRQVIVSLSPAGEAILRDETHAREAWLRDQLSQLDVAGRNSVRVAIDAFDKMVASAD